MKLLKCPFCNKNDEDSEIWTSIDKVSNRWQINHFCKDIENGDIFLISAYADTKEKCIELWNRRASQ